MVSELGELANTSRTRVLEVTSNEKQSLRHQEHGAATNTTDNTEKQTLQLLEHELAIARAEMQELQEPFCDGRMQRLENELTTYEVEISANQAADARMQVLQGEVENYKAETSAHQTVELQLRTLET